MSLRAVALTASTFSEMRRKGSEQRQRRTKLNCSVRLDLMGIITRKDEEAYSLYLMPGSERWINTRTVPASVQYSLCVSQSIARPAGLSKLVSTTTCTQHQYHLSYYSHLLHKGGFVCVVLQGSVFYTFLPIIYKNINNLYSRHPTAVAWKDLIKGKNYTFTKRTVQNKALVHISFVWFLIYYIHALPNYSILYSIFYLCVYLLRWVHK